ncbi:kinase-like protein [Eremomyces bilateralis CBS 781.70]|uniref:Kinase-like protein n=1 Tax=Eremomyces bilateralis CBS 781.70 TaxID=1392243 RepID=A0A6G1FVF0_9PEZI|nr:kinase-like protein [Eremomyces bilateralis CBS 781.70]KAF1809686.1 kinase-like protein [Eremomyces bilateralis CBS 781.70]
MVYDGSRCYEQRDFLGLGAQARVARVYDTVSGEEFAQKVFEYSIHKLGYSTWRQQATSEIDIMHKLREASRVVRLFDWYEGITGSIHRICVVLYPVANGGSLKDWLNQKFREPSSTMTRDELVTMLMNLALGLLEIHNKSIRHRDIKPGNILVHNGGVLYSDFGLSLDFEPSGNSVTNSPYGVHTPVYAPPEILAMQPRDRKSDVFCLGDVFLEILAVYEKSRSGGSGTMLRRVTRYGQGNSYRYADGVGNGSIQGALYSILGWDGMPGLENVLQLISTMLEVELKKRPSAYEVLTKLAGPYGAPAAAAADYDDVDDDDGEDEEGEEGEQ